MLQRTRPSLALQVLQGGRLQSALRRLALQVFSKVVGRQARPSSLLPCSYGKACPACGPVVAALEAGSPVFRGTKAWHPPSRPLHLLAWRGVERELPWRTRGDKRPDSMSPVELCNTALLLLGGCCGRRLAACSSNLCNAGVSGSWAAGPDLGCVPGAERVLAKQACRSTSFHCMLASVGVFCAHVAGCDVLGCVVAALCCTHARSMDWKTTWGCSCAAHRGLLRLLGQRSCVLQLGV